MGSKLKVILSEMGRNILLLKKAGMLEVKEKAFAVIVNSEAAHDETLVQIEAMQKRIDELENRLGIRNHG